VTNLLSGDGASHFFFAELEPLRYPRTSFIQLFVHSSVEGNFQRRLFFLL